MLKHKLKIFVTSLIFSILFGFILTFHFSNRIRKNIMVYAEEEANKVLSTIVNKIVLEDVTTYVNFDKLFDINKDNNGNIKTIDFNALAVNDILSFVTSSVDENLNKFDNGNLDFMEYITTEYSPPIEMRNKGIIALIPLGISLNNVYFANLGPKIPVKIKYIGSVSTNLNTIVKDYGINNALITLSVHITVSERIYVPFSSKKIIVENDIPVALRVIQGNVPSYYGSIISRSSPILSSNVDNS